MIGDRLFQEIIKDPNLRPFDPDTGNYNSFWLVDRSVDNRTSLIIDPPNGRMPPRVAKPAQTRRPQEAGTAGPANPEDVNLNERCITYGVPWLVAGYNSYIQIFQTPNYVAILQEMIHDVRIVPLDGRPHVDGSVRLWNGDSRGRFEGDTLVVTTTNYSPKTRLQGSSENLRLVERFRRVSPDTLEYRLTFEDPDRVDRAVDDDDSAEAFQRAGPRIRLPRGESLVDGHSRRRTHPRERRRQLAPIALGGITRAAASGARIIHDVPNLSLSCPKRVAKNVSDIGIRICPPSARTAQTRSASSGPSTVSDR